MAWRAAGLTVTLKFSYPEADVGQWVLLASSGHSAPPMIAAE